MRLIRILFAGDVMGSPGRRAAGSLLAALRSRLDADFVIVNGENAAGGTGITRPTGRDIFDAGADVITLGNHAFAKREALEYVEEEPRLLRPANLAPAAPGRGWGVFDTASGCRITVANLLGRTFMQCVDCPFRAADKMIDELGGLPRVTVVDMHAEATSEKVATGWHLNGRVSAVIGTHTHIQTSDERVLPGGTAYISDVGMTGVLDSVLGLDPDSVIRRFMTQLPSKFVLAKGEAALQAVVVEIDADTGRAVSISRMTLREGTQQ